MQLDTVVSLDVEDTAMIERISGRYTCGPCGEGYHDTHKQPTKPGVCDHCGGTDFKRRADDNAEAVSERLKAYHAETAPLIAYYRFKSLLNSVDAMGDIAAIHFAAGPQRTIFDPDVRLFSFCRLVCVGNPHRS